ncbi:PH domain-containing protein [Pseudoalteromonas piratica]|uniref:Membrane protein n=1 Tax=Pseudoalteromonas piratica TaxID=1348114 RepID=A0A0A7EDP6_9GAMM|nr:PH domain-containing protein [Pseudoalteromonas piratica]AIY64191.1 membrane protein [Pseudoalteromonas piratica]
MFSNQQVFEQMLPDYNQADFQPLDQQATKEALIGTFVFVLPISIAVTIFLYFLPPVTNLITALAAGALVLLNIYIAWFTKRSVAMTGIALREHDLLLKRGVFWQRTIAIPFNRIQHIETHRNPIERKLKLATLKLFTAGGAGADLEIHGLTQERASKLRQFILANTASEQHEYE